MLLLAQVKDAINFFSLQYRSDVKELGLGQTKDYIMTEEQFDVLEQFTAELLKIDRTKKLAVPVKYVKTKDYILGLRKRVGVTMAMSKLLFNSDEAE